MAGICSTIILFRSKSNGRKNQVEESPRKTIEFNKRTTKFKRKKKIFTKPKRIHRRQQKTTSKCFLLICFSFVLHSIGLMIKGKPWFDFEIRTWDFIKIQKQKYNLNLTLNANDTMIFNQCQPFSFAHFPIVSHSTAKRDDFSYHYFEYRKRLLLANERNLSTLFIFK